MMNYYKLYFHGDFVGTAHAMTRGEAVTQFSNRSPGYAESGLMAVHSN